MDLNSFWNNSIRYDNKQAQLQKLYIFIMQYDFQMNILKINIKGHT